MLGVLGLGSDGSPLTVDGVRLDRGVHLRWALDPSLPLPIAGFSVGRRRHQPGTAARVPLLGVRSLNQARSIALPTPAQAIEIAMSEGYAKATVLVDHGEARVPVARGTTVGTARLRLEGEALAALELEGKGEIDKLTYFVSGSQNIEPLVRLQLPIVEPDAVLDRANVVSRIRCGVIAFSRLPAAMAQQDRLARAAAFVDACYEPMERLLDSHEVWDSEPASAGRPAMRSAWLDLLAVAAIDPWIARMLGWAWHDPEVLDLRWDYTVSAHFGHLGRLIDIGRARLRVGQIIAGPYDGGGVTWIPAGTATVGAGPSVSLRGGALLPHVLDLSSPVEHVEIDVSSPARVVAWANGSVVTQVEGEGTLTLESSQSIDALTLPDDTTVTAIRVSHALSTKATGWARNLGATNPGEVRPVTHATVVATPRPAEPNDSAPVTLTASARLDDLHDVLRPVVGQARLRWLGDDESPNTQGQWQAWNDGRTFGFADGVASTRSSVSPGWWQVELRARCLFGRASTWTSAPGVRAEAPPPIAPTSVALRHQPVTHDNSVETLEVTWSFTEQARGFSPNADRFEVVIVDGDPDRSEVRVISVDDRGDDSICMVTPMLDPAPFRGGQLLIGPTAFEIREARQVAPYLRLAVANRSSPFACPTIDDATLRPRVPGSARSTVIATRSVKLKDSLANYRSVVGGQGTGPWQARVRTVDSRGAGGAQAQSPWIRATSAPLQPPAWVGAPELVLADPPDQNGISRARLAWEPAPGASGYVVYRALRIDDAAFVAAHQGVLEHPSFEDDFDGRAAGEWEIRLQTVDVTGRRSELGPTRFIVRVPAFRPLERPRWVETAVNGARVQLRWSPIRGAEAWRIHRAPLGIDPLGRQPIVELRDGLRFTDAPGDGAWTWAVVAVGTGGLTSEPSESVTLDVRDPSPPAIPTWTALEWGPNGAKLAWTVLEQGLQCRVERGSPDGPATEIIRDWHDTELDDPLAFKCRDATADRQQGASYHIHVRRRSGVAAPHPTIGVLRPDSP